MSGCQALYCLHRSVSHLSKVKLGRLSKKVVIFEQPDVHHTKQTQN